MTNGYNKIQIRNVKYNRNAKVVKLDNYVVKLTTLVKAKSNQELVVGWLNGRISVLEDKTNYILCKIKSK